MGQVGVFSSVQPDVGRWQMAWRSPWNGTSEPPLSPRCDRLFYASPTSQRPHFTEVGHTKTRFKKVKDQVLLGQTGQKRGRTTWCRLGAERPSLDSAGGVRSAPKRNLRGEQWQKRSILASCRRRISYPAPWLTQLMWLTGPGDGFSY